MLQSLYSNARESGDTCGAIASWFYPLIRLGCAAVLSTANGKIAYLNCQIGVRLAINLYLYACMGKRRVLIVVARHSLSFYC